MKVLHMLGDKDLISYIRNVESSLFFETTTEEMSVMLPFIRKFLVEINRFKDNKKFDHYQPLINHSEPLAFQTLLQYQKRWSALQKPVIKLITENFPLTNSEGFLVYLDERK